MPPRTRKAQSTKNLYPQICQVCLKTDVSVTGIEERLGYFYEDFCDFDCSVKRKTLFCADCLDALNRCYLFKKQCKIAAKLLTNWCKIDPKLKKPITVLSEQLINYNFNESDDDIHLDDSDSDRLITDDENEKITKTTPKTKKTNKIITITKPGVVKKVGKVKIELDDNADSHKDVTDSQTGVVESHVNTADSSNDGADNHNSTDIIITDDNVVAIDKLNYDSDEENDNNYQDELKDETVEVIVKDEKNDKIVNEPFKLTTKGVKYKNNKITIIKKEELKSSKYPLKDQAEYEKVFDILLLKNREEELAEFAQRKFGAYYLKADYRCDVCFTVYRSQKQLNFHMKWHDPSAGDSICDVCSMRFGSRLQLRKHKHNNHFGRFACKMCPLVTYHKAVMIFHYKKHMGYEYKCKVCSKVFRHVSTAMSHERMAHVSRFVCGACARTFLSDCGLRQHRVRIHKTNTLVEEEGEARCDECNVIFTTVDVYNIHLKNTPIHQGQFPNITLCKDCGKQLPNKYSLWKHRLEAHPDRVKSDRNYMKDYKQSCELCNATGTYPTWLYRHMQRVHPEVDYVPKSTFAKKYLCDQCGKGFISPALLSEHQNMHTGARPFACTRCGARYRSLMSLRLHEDRHRPPTRECHRCGKKFISASNLSNHMRSHIGDRRYKCNICGKGFIHANALNEHIRGVHLHVRRVRKARGTPAQLVSVTQS